MSLHRFEIEARLEDGMTERRVGGGGLQLVTVCLCDEGAGEVSDELGEPLVRPAVVTHVRPSAGARAGVLFVGTGGAGRAAQRGGAG